MGPHHSLCHLPFMRVSRMDNPLACDPPPRCRNPAASSHHKRASQAISPGVPWIAIFRSQGCFVRMIPPPENVAPSRLALFGRLRSRLLRARVLEGAGGAKGGVSVRERSSSGLE